MGGEGGRLSFAHLSEIGNEVDCFKGAVCNNYGDLLRQMVYNTYNYVVSAI